MLFFFKGEETQQESYKYLTVDEMKSLGDDSMPIDVTHDEGMKKSMDRSTEYPTNVSVSKSYANIHRLNNTNIRDSL